MVFDRPTSVHSASRCFQGGGFSESADDVVWEKQGCLKPFKVGSQNLGHGGTSRSCWSYEGGVVSKLSNTHEGAMGKNAGAFPCALFMNDDGDLQGMVCSKST